MKFTDSHEWISIQDDIGIVGLSRHAREELGEIVYIELPQVGIEVQCGKEIVVLESTKAAADLYSPVSGTVIEVNQAVKEDPELLNAFPETKGWLFKLCLKDRLELDSLLDLKQYHQLISKTRV